MDADGVSPKKMLEDVTGPVMDLEYIAYMARNEAING